MKKKTKIIVLCSVIVLIVLAGILFIPFQNEELNDGGTTVHGALLYKVVNWNRLTEEGIYHETDAYWLSDAHKSIPELWDAIDSKREKQFLATVTKMGDGYVEVEPLQDEWENSCSELFRIDINGLPDIGVTLFDTVKIAYTGYVMEIYPATVHAINWSMSEKYSGNFINPEQAEENGYLFQDVTIVEKYDDCIIVRPIIPSPYLIKLNGSIGKDWCVGDQVAVTYENAYMDKETAHIEGKLLIIAPSSFRLEPGVCYKPVIYLYPEKEMPVSVDLQLHGDFTCTYPPYQDGWHVTASPDGTLWDAKGQSYNYLYWEGKTDARYDFTKGFCIKGEDTAAFLETALAKLGLNRKEANEFIVYWLPLMQENPYNVISFQEKAYTDSAVLTVTPTPDTVIRIFMAFYGCKTPVAIENPILSSPKREGFTVVEWGGTQVPEP